MKFVININTKYAINVTEDKRLAFVICWIVFWLFLVNSSSLVGNFLGIDFQKVSSFGWLTTFVLLFFNMILIAKKISKEVVLSLVFLNLIFLINFLCIDYYDENFNLTAKRFVFYVCPIVLVYLSINDFRKLLKFLINISKIILPASLFISIISRFNLTVIYSMGFSYSLLLPVNALILDYYKTNNLKSLVFSLFGIIAILMAGSRGPLLCIFFFVLILFLRKLYNTKNIIKGIIAVLLFSILLLLKSFVLQTFIYVTGNFGWHSRTLELFANDIYHDSGRFYIYQTIIEEIERHPFTLHGIAGEYQFTGGLYAHNFVLELLCSFGVLLGGIAVLYIVFQFFKTLFYFITKDSAFYSVSCLMLSISFPSLLVSGTVWGNPYFWVWLFLSTYSSKEICLGVLPYKE